MPDRAAWNAGKNVGTKRALTQEPVWAVRFDLTSEVRASSMVWFQRAVAHSMTKPSQAASIPMGL